jgi:hypothetical protein
VILIEPLGRDPGGEEGIALEIEALGAIAFGDPHVAKKHCPPFLSEKLFTPP